MRREMRRAQCDIPNESVRRLQLRLSLAMGIGHAVNRDAGNAAVVCRWCVDLCLHFFRELLFSASSNSGREWRSCSACA
jgi:hypothetical protein